MLSKCANPHCDAQFRYLSQGRLFEVDIKKWLRGEQMPDGMQAAERFWLCPECSLKFTIVVDRGMHMHVVPVEKNRKAHRALAS